MCFGCCGANGQLGSVALLIYSCPRSFNPSTDPEGRHGTDRGQKMEEKKGNAIGGEKVQDKAFVEPLEEEVVRPVISRW